MDKLFEQIAKILPPPFLVGLLALGITFFATYYARGYRAYGDVLHDAFLRNAAVAICAATVLFWMNADRMTPPESNPVVLIPFFANDEHDQYRTALSSQIEERLNAAFRKNGTVFKLPSFLNDDATAKQIAGKFHASAVLYEANVIDGKDTRMACFKLLQIEPELYKTYSLVPMSVPDVQMDEIVTTLRGSQTALAPDAAATNALLGRLQSLQSQVDLLQAELHDARTKTTEAEHGSTAAIEPAQGERRALIIAADSTPGGELPVLAFARSDAEHMSATLTQLGYKSMLLLGNAATHSPDHSLPDNFVVISLAKFSDEHYGLKEKQVQVQALGNWARHMAPPSILEFIVVLLMRQAASFVVPSLSKSVHLGTKGCLFDFTSDLAEARYKALQSFVCTTCRSRMQENGAVHLADDMIRVLDFNWLGTTSDPRCPSGIVAKLGYDLFLTKGFQPTFWESVRSIFRDEATKEIIKLVFAILLAALLLRLNLKEH